MADHEERICIIGAGPAGISAGMYLEQKGYTNYTILEQADHVGGKCCSPVYNGKHYEIGAIMGVPSYFAVQDAEAFCGVTHDGPKLSSEYKALDGSVVTPMHDETGARDEEILEMKNQFRQFAFLLETKYKGYDVNGHRGTAEGRYEGFTADRKRLPVSGENEALKDLALPFKEFCELNGCPLVTNLWIDPFTAFGYGYFDEIPAAYVLKYLDLATNMAFMSGRHLTWKDGTQNIWEQVNRKLKKPARLNSHISSVKRGAGGSAVKVTVNGTEEEYDKVIVTSPLQFMPDYFDADDDERALFSKIRYEKYDTLGMTIQDGCYPENSYFIRENMVKERCGRLMLYYRRWADAPDQVVVSYAIRNYTGCPDVSVEDCKENVLSDMTDMGAPVKGVVDQKTWYYFPHVLTEDYAAGWYDRVEAMQGRRNTYYAGEVMSFGDMDETAEYSRELVERFF